MEILSIASDAGISVCIIKGSWMVSACGGLSSAFASFLESEPEPEQ